MKPKTKPTPKYNVTYIKLHPYLIPFMYKKHGNPMSFQSLTNYDILMVNHLVCNKQMHYFYTDLSFSEYAYGIAIGTKSPQLDMFARASVPKNKDLENIAPIIIPESVIALDYDGDIQGVETNEYYQFTRSGAEGFRKYAMAEFCGVLSEYISKADIMPTKDNPNVVTESKKDCLIKFMLDYDIDPKHFDNLYRHLPNFVANNCS